MKLFLLKPFGSGKYIFDFNCEQDGEYVPVKQVWFFAYMSIVSNVTKVTFDCSVISDGK